MQKDFDSWNDFKKKIEEKMSAPTFKQQEVLWCSIGLNIGHEENGKNEFFNRPVLVVRKFSKHIFLGVPLSTKLKDSKFYFPIHLKGRNGSAMLSQIKVLGSERLTHKIGELTGSQFEMLRGKIRELI